MQQAHAERTRDRELNAIREPTAPERSGGGLTAGFDARRLVAIFRRHLRLFGVAAGVAILVVATFTLAQPVRFTATASVMLDPQKETVTKTEDVLSALPAESSVVDTEVEVMKSRQLAERVVAALQLDDDPEFNPALRSRSELGGFIGEIKSAVKPRASRREPELRQRMQARRHAAVIDAVLRQLIVARVGLTYVMKVSFTSEDPDKAALIDNKFAELYLQEQLDAKSQATQQATSWLNGRLTQLRNQVLADDAAVQQYKIANNLLSASGTNLTEQEISSFNQNRGQAQAQLAEDEARLNTARAQLAHGSKGDDVGEALDSPVVQQLREARTEVSARVADMQGRYGPRHPEMLKAQRQLQDIDGQIQAEIRRIISNLEAKVEVSRQRLGAIDGSIGLAKGTLAANNRAVVRLNELQRTADASRTLYESYLNRYKETSSQQGIGQSDARIVSRAKVPSSPSSPNLELAAAIGLMLAMASGAGAVLVAELLSRGLTTAADVEDLLGTAHLGNVPLFSSVVRGQTQPPADYIVDKPMSGFAEAFRDLRTSIAYLRPTDSGKIVAITSALPGEGKTTTSLCLARTAAVQGAKVILVDCDLRRRTLNRFLGIAPKAGLLEVITGSASLDEAILADNITSAHFLLLAQSAFPPQDVFGEDAMGGLLDELRERYDIVLLDTAPVLPVADTRVIASRSDAVVFVVRWRKTAAQAVESAFRRLSGTGAHIAGVALTRVDVNQQAKYGGGDPGCYFRQYREYYST